MADKPRQVRITAAGPKATVLVGGHDLSKAVRGYSIEHVSGQMPLIVLHAQPGVDPVLFEGMSNVAVAFEPAEDPVADVVAFLAGIDPDALARAALQRDDLDGGRNELTRAALRQLIDWAQGKAG